MRCLAPATCPFRGPRSLALLTGVAVLLCAAWTSPSTGAPGRPPARAVSPGGLRDSATTGAGVLVQQGQVPASEESSNWSGYEDAGPGAVFTQVSASWTVPVLEPGITGSSSAWIGIDGAATPDLIQAGTEQDWTVSGPLYYAWYELLPGTAVNLGAVKPGDRVTADIDETGNAKWAISITDSTSGSSWNENVSYRAPGGSVEWVVEAPSSGSTGAVEPLAAFGSVTFSDLSVSGPSTAGSAAQPVYLVHGGNQLIEAYPGAYDVGSDSFTDYFGSPLGQVLTSSVVISTPAQGTAGSSTARTPGGDGYWLAGTGGAVSAFGDARNYGSAGTLHLHLAQPVVAIVPAPLYRGYWLVARDGGVFDFGGAPYEGSLPSLGIGPVGSKSRLHLTSPIVGAAPSAEGHGYYMVSANGGVFSFGDARYEGSCASAGGCKAPVTAIVPDGPGGYWLLLSDCQTLAMGGIANITSLDCQRYARSHDVSAVAVARTPSGRGYWALLSNGVVFAEGDALHFGHWAPTEPPGPSGAKAVSILATPAGDGAWVMFSDGEVRAYGQAPKLGSAARSSLSAPIVASAGW